MLQAVSSANDQKWPIRHAVQAEVGESSLTYSLADNLVKTKLFVLSEVLDDSPAHTAATQEKYTERR